MTSTWAQRGRTALWIATTCVALLTVKELIDDWRMARLLKRRREREANMHVGRRDDWTLEELKAYDGSDPDKPILMAVDGKVFNVWRGWNFYGPGSAYEELAGRDATRLLAKGLLDASEDDGQPLSEEEQDALDGWKQHYAFKYEDVGTLRREEAAA